MVIVPFKVSEEERENIRHDAKKHGMAVSAYIRWLILKERDGKCGSGTKH